MRGAGIGFQVPGITFISSSMALLSLSTPRQNCRLMSSRGRLDFTLFWWSVCYSVVWVGRLMSWGFSGLVGMIQEKLTKLYNLARSLGAESSRVQANSMTWPTWMPASWPDPHVRFVRAVSLGIRRI